MNAIKTSAVLSGLTLNTDNSARFRVTTPEVDDGAWNVLRKLCGKNVTVVISPADVTETGTTEVTGTEDKKTPSQRLRAVLYVLWTQVAPGCPFDEFYRQRIDRFISITKDEIDGYE